MKRLVKRALDLASKNQGRICNFTGINYVNGVWEDEDPSTLASLSYGDLEDTEAAKSTSFFVWGLATGSDYAGDSVTVANHKALLEIAGDEARKRGLRASDCGVFDVSGGFSTYAVAVRLNCTLKAVWRAIEACLDYPLIDEELLSEIESEAQTAALDSWARSEFKRAVLNLLDEYDEWDLDEVPEADLDQLFYQAAEAENEYWINETGNSAYIDTKKVAKGVKMEDLVNLPGIIFNGEPEDRPAFMRVIDAERAGQMRLVM